MGRNSVTRSDSTEGSCLKPTVFLVRWLSEGALAETASVADATMRSDCAAFSFFLRVQ